MNALFRTAELSEGCILIDGVDTSKIGLKQLRSKIAIIPQVPSKNKCEKKSDVLFRFRFSLLARSERIWIRSANMTTTFYGEPFIERI